MLALFFSGFDLRYAILFSKSNPDFPEFGFTFTLSRTILLKISKIRLKKIKNEKFN